MTAAIPTVSVLARDAPAAAGADQRTRITVFGLSKTFKSATGDVVAVDDVSFDVRQGEFVALLGPSGCGKSTILNMVAGLLDKSDGRISIDSDEVRHGTVNRKVGYVFQRDTVFPWRTVEANIGYGLEIAGVPKAERAQRVQRAIEVAGLAGFAKSFPRMLSGGMRQRVALMRTLIMEPEILLMDEPFGALDELTRSEMQLELLRIWEARKKTVIFVTHSIMEALYLSDRVVVFSPHPGRLRAEITVTLPRPRQRSSHEFMALYEEIHRAIF